MGFLQIMGYIGIGLGSAVLLSIIDVLISRVKMTYIYGESNFNEFDVNFYRAAVVAVFELFAIGALMLYIMANLPLLMALGIAAIGTVVYSVVSAVINSIIAKKTNLKDDDKELLTLLFYIITCLLNGAGIAVLLAFKGVF